MRATRRYVYAALFLSSLAGCSSTPPYPADWPSPVAHSGPECQNLTGSYDNYGLWSDGDRILLANVLFGDPDLTDGLAPAEVTAVSQITLDRSDDKQYVARAWVGAELLAERLLDRTQLACRAGQLVYHDTSWSFGGLPPFVPMLAHSSVDRVISLASDLSLVMDNQEREVGAVVVIPLAFTSRYWFRFLPAPSEPGTSQTFDNAPNGVRTTAARGYRLLPPPDAAKWSGYDDAKGCLGLETASGQELDPAEVELLEGRTTQAFILQDGRGGTVSLNGTVVDSNWVPMTHDLRVEKQHWLAPSVSDRYVVCLINKGYRWAKDSDPPS